MTYFGQLNGSNIVDIMSYNNNVTGDVFGLTIVLMVFVLSFVVVSRNQQIESAIATSMFITFISAVLLASMTVINPTYIAWTIVGLAISVFVLWKSKSV